MCLTARTLLYHNWYLANRLLIDCLAAGPLSHLPHEQVFGAGKLLLGLVTQRDSTQGIRGQGFLGQPLRRGQVIPYFAVYGLGVPHMRPLASPVRAAQLGY